MARRDYAELYFPRPDRYTQLWVWLRNVDARQPTRESQYALRLVREQTGELLAQGGGASSAMALQRDWNGYKLSFRPPGSGTGPHEFPAATFLGTDGVYRIELDVDGKSYAKYRFTVAGGRLQRAQSEATDAANARFSLVSEPNSWALRRVP
jgi:hypothetical protein